MTIILLRLSFTYVISAFKKSLKILKGLSEAINRGRTVNTIVKIKRTKGQTTIYKTFH